MRMKWWHWIVLPLAAIGLAISLYRMFTTPWAWDFPHIGPLLLLAGSSAWIFIWLRDGNEGVKARWRRVSEYEPSENAGRRNLLIFMTVIIALLVFLSWWKA